MNVRWYALVAVIFIVTLLTTPLHSAEDQWFVLFEADNGSGMYLGPRARLGVQPSASNESDSSDCTALYGTEISQTTRWAVSRIGDSSETLTANIGSPGSPALYGGVRSWPLYVGGLPLCNNDPVRIRIFRSSIEAGRTPDSVDGVPVRYRLVMADNKGLSNAPTNGTIWDLPISSSTAIGYVHLPLVRLSAPTHSAMIAEGLQLRFEQYVATGAPVPEPAGLMGLGLGMAGLIGSLRRRRSARSKKGGFRRPSV